MQFDNLVADGLLRLVGIMHSTADNRVRKLLGGHFWLIDTGAPYLRLQLRFRRPIPLVRYNQKQRQTDDYGGNERFHVPEARLNQTGREMPDNSLVSSTPLCLCRFVRRRNRFKFVSRSQWQLVPA